MGMYWAQRNLVMGLLKTRLISFSIFINFHSPHHKEYEYAFTYVKDANLLSTTSTDDFETCVIKMGWKQSMKCQTKYWGLITKISATSQELVRLGVCVARWLTGNVMQPWKKANAIGGWAWWGIFGRKWEILLPLQGFTAGITAPDQGRFPSIPSAVGGYWADPGVQRNLIKWEETRRACFPQQREGCEAALFQHNHDGKNREEEPFHLEDGAGIRTNGYKQDMDTFWL